MLVPRKFDHVHLGGSHGVFVVTFIDDESQLADLVPVAGVGPMEADIPWERLYLDVPSLHATIKSEFDSNLRNTADRWSQFGSVT
jgi:hypothetical protein